MASRKDGLKSLVQAITNDKLLKFGIPVLYNICVDYGTDCRWPHKGGGGVEEIKSIKC